MSLKYIEDGPFLIYHNTYSIVKSNNLIYQIVGFDFLQAGYGSNSINELHLVNSIFESKIRYQTAFETCHYLIHFMENAVVVKQ